jgi:hypothetical protein
MENTEAALVVFTASSPSGELIDIPDEDRNQIYDQLDSFVMSNPIQKLLGEHASFEIAIRAIEAV